MQKPQRLKKGDKIGIIAPASSPNQKALEKSLAFLTMLGLEYEFGKTAHSEYGYLSATDDLRKADVEDMFRREDIAGIICACGGYGSARYTDTLDFELIRQNPKIFWGYSDITFLHNAFQRHADLVTFHGPMLGSDIGHDTFLEQSAAQFQQLFTPTALVYDGCFYAGIETVVEGVAHGKIVGGNLSLLASAVGTDYMPLTAGNLLLIEDVDEEPYRVDGMLNQLRMAGVLNEVSGVIIASFSGAEPKKRKKSLTLDEVFAHYFASLQVPVVKGVQIGHCQPHFALPLGVNAVLDATNCMITIEAGVQ